MDWDAVQEISGQVGSSADAFDRSVGRYAVQSFAAEDREQTRYQDKIGNPTSFPTRPDNYKTHPTTYSLGFFQGIVSSDFTHSSLSFCSMYVTPGMVSTGDDGQSWETDGLQLI
jgi:hypothetical protein